MFADAKFWAIFLLHESQKWSRKQCLLAEFEHSFVHIIMAIFGCCCQDCRHEMSLRPCKSSRNAAQKQDLQAFTLSMLSEGFHASKVYSGFCTPTSLSLLNGIFIFFPIWKSYYASYRKGTSEFRSRVNREVGMGSHSLSHSSPVPKKPYDFHGRKAPWEKKVYILHPWRYSY